MIADAEQVEVRRIDNADVRERQIARLKTLRETRDQTAVDAALDALSRCGIWEKNLCHLPLKRRASVPPVGEMSDALAAKFGRHTGQNSGVRGIWRQHIAASADLDI